MITPSKPKATGSESTALPRIDASAFFATGREVILVHKDMEYRLRLTSNDRLILTK